MKRTNALLACLLGALIFCGHMSAWGSDSPSAADPHATPSGDGHAPAGDSTPNPLTIDPDLAAFTLIVFGLLLLVLWKFAWGPIMSALDHREQGIADHVAGAEAKHEEAKQLLAGHAKKLAGTADEVRALLEEARRDAEQTKSTILAEAKAAAEAERERALRDVQSATDAAMQAISERGADMAVELAGRIVQSELKADDHAKLIRDAIGRIPEGSPSKN